MQQGKNSWLSAVGKKIKDDQAAAADAGGHVAAGAPGAGARAGGHHRGLRRAVRVASHIWEFIDPSLKRPIWPGS